MLLTWWLQLTRSPILHVLVEHELQEVFDPGQRGSNPLRCVPLACLLRPVTLAVERSKLLGPRFCQNFLLVSKLCRGRKESMAYFEGASVEYLSGEKGFVDVNGNS